MAKIYKMQLTFKAHDLEKKSSSFLPNSIAIYVIYPIKAPKI